MKRFSLLLTLCAVVLCAFMLVGCEPQSTDHAYFTISALPVGVENFNFSSSSTDPGGTYEIKGATEQATLLLVEGFELNTLTVLIDNQAATVDAESGSISFTVPDHDFTVSFSGETKLHQTTVSLKAQELLDANDDTILSEAGKSVAQIRDEYTIALLKEYIPSNTASQYHAQANDTAYTFTLGYFIQMVTENEVSIVAPYGEKIVLTVSNRNANINIADLFEMSSDGSYVTNAMQQGDSAGFGVSADSVSERKFTLTVGWQDCRVELHENRAIDDGKTVGVITSYVGNLFDFSFEKGGTSTNEISFEDVSQMQTTPVKLVLTLKSDAPNRDSVKTLFQGKTVQLNVNGETVDLTASADGFSFYTTLKAPFGYADVYFGNYFMERATIKENDVDVGRYLADNNVAYVVSMSKSALETDGASGFYIYKTPEGNSEIGETEDNESYTLYGYNGALYFQIESQNGGLFTGNEISSVLLNGTTRIRLGETDTASGVSLVWNSAAGHFYVTFSKTATVSSLTFSK